MRSEREIREMIDRIDEYRQGLAWWDDAEEQTACIIDALLWVLGDASGKPIDPAMWNTDE